MLIGHEADGVGRVDTIEDGDLVVYLHVCQLRAYSLEFVSDPRDLGIGTVGFEVVTENAFPISLLTGMDGMPMPVLNHIGAAGNVSVDVQEHLAGVGR